MSEIQAQNPVSGCESSNLWLGCVVMCPKTELPCIQNLDKSGFVCIQMIRKIIKSRYLESAVVAEITACQSIKLIPCLEDERLIPAVFACGAIFELLRFVHATQTRAWAHAQ